MFDNTSIKNEIFCNKNVWKNVCETFIWDKAKLDFYQRVAADNDFWQIIEIHHKPSTLWITAKESHYMPTKC